jgi:hypothetical protein
MLKGIASSFQHDLYEGIPALVAGQNAILKAYLPKAFMVKSPQAIEILNCILSVIRNGAIFP